MNCTVKIIMDDFENITAIECTDCDVERTNADNELSNEKVAQHIIPGIFLIILAIRYFFYIFFCNGGEGQERKGRLNL